MTTYKDIKKLINPLDLILFKGSDIVSNTISLLEKKEVGNGDFSHAGMIVTSDLLPNVPQLKKGRLYVLESTFSHNIPHIIDGPPDVITGKGKFGCQIRDFKEVVITYTKSGKVAFCKLLNNPWLVESNRPTLIDLMNITYNKYGTDMYDYDPLDLLSALYPILRPLRNLKNKLKKKNRKNGKKWEFCSELVAQVYKSLHIINNNKNPGDYLPVDFLGYDKNLSGKIVENPIYII